MLIIFDVLCFVFHQCPHNPTKSIRHRSDDDVNMMFFLQSINHLRRLFTFTNEASCTVNKKLANIVVASLAHGICQDIFPMDMF